MALWQPAERGGVSFAFPDAYDASKPAASSIPLLRGYVQSCSSGPKRASMPSLVGVRPVVVEGSERPARAGARDLMSGL